MVKLLRVGVDGRNEEAPFPAGRGGSCLKSENGVELTRESMFSPKTFPGLLAYSRAIAYRPEVPECEVGVNRPEVLFYPQVVETVNAIKLRQL